MALLLKLQSVVENKTVNLDGTETIISYDVSLNITTDTAPDKILANKAVSIAAGQTLAESKEDLKNKTRSWWQESLAEYDRKINLRTIAQAGIDELLVE